MRYRGLKRVETVIHWQEGMPAKGKDDRLFLGDSTDDFGCLGPVGRSQTEFRALLLATVLALRPLRLARTLRLS